MKKFFLSFALFATLSLFLTSCDKDDDVTTENLTLSINGLQDLGPSAAYEGWIIVNGQALTTGVFTVDANGNLSQTEFELEREDLENASTFVLTIEPSPDPDPGPSSVHILAGDFSGISASLNIEHSAALGNNFASSSGKYILATPTDDDNTTEKSGIWFLDNSSGSPAPGLILPELPNGWAYEGWSVIDGIPVSTGVFTSVSDVDDAALRSGNNPGPPFPGEDFLTNAPSGLSFPTDLSGTTAVISIEPVPDNSEAPFLLKPLVGQVPANALEHTVYEMGQNLSFPNGSAVR